MQLEVLRFQHIATGVCIGVFISLLLVAKDFYGLYQLHIPVFESDHIYKVNATFGHKNLVASYLVLALPFLLVLSSYVKRWGKIFLFSLIIVAVGVLVVLQTRAALLALFLAAIVYILYLFANGAKLNNKYKWMLPVLVTCFVVGLFGGIYVFRDKFSVITRTESFRERAALWQNTVDMIKEFPLGVGAGNWQIFLPKYGVQKFYEFNYRVTEGLTTFQRPHNDFLWVWSETGPVGGIAFLGLFVFTIITVVRNKEFYFTKEVVAAIVAFAVVGLVDFPLERVEHTMLFMSFLAFVIPSKQLVVASISYRNNRVFYLFLMLASLSVLWWCYQRWQSELALKKMYRAHVQQQWVRLAQEAHKADGRYMNMDYFSIPISWYQGVANFGQGNLVEAKQSFLHAYAVNPYQIHVLNNLGVCFEKEKNYEEALPLLEQAVAISPTFSDGISTLAGAYYNCKRYEDAWRVIATFTYDETNYQYIHFATEIIKANLRVLQTNERDDGRKIEIEKLLLNDELIKEKLKGAKNKPITYFLE
jgi:O-antigen ligase